MRAMPREAASQQIRSIARAAWPRPSFSGLCASNERHDIASIKRVRYGWKELFDLVLDLERYPAFVPHCRAVKVLSRRVDDQDRSIIVSRMTVGVAGLDVSYANRTIGDPAARRITVAALDGPLRRLDVLWTFEPDGEEWSNVGFCVDYASDSAILSAVASRAFDAMFGEILAAFERRADRLSGRAASSLNLAELRRLGSARANDGV